MTVVMVNMMTQGKRLAWVVQEGVYRSSPESPQEKTYRKLDRQKSRNLQVKEAGSYCFALGVYCFACGVLSTNAY